MGGRISTTLATQFAGMTTSGKLVGWGAFLATAIHTLTKILTADGSVL